MDSTPSLPKRSLNGVDKQNSEELNLAGLKLASIDPYLVFFSRMRSIRRLSLAENALSCLPLDLSVLQSVEVLDLSGNYFRTASAVLTGLRSMPQLKHLFITLPSVEEESRITTSLPFLLTFNGKSLSHRNPSGAKGVEQASLPPSFSFSTSTNVEEKREEKGGEKRNPVLEGRVNAPNLPSSPSPSWYPPPSSRPVGKEVKKSLMNALASVESLYNMLSTCFPAHFPSLQSFLAYKHQITQEAEVLLSSFSPSTLRNVDGEEIVFQAHRLLLDFCWKQLALAMEWAERWGGSDDTEEEVEEKGKWVSAVHHKKSTREGGERGGGAEVEEGGKKAAQRMISSLMLWVRIIREHYAVLLAHYEGHGRRGGGEQGEEEGERRKPSEEEKIPFSSTIASRECHHQAPRSGAPPHDVLSSSLPPPSPVLSPPFLSQEPRCGWGNAPMGKAAKGEEEGVEENFEKRSAPSTAGVTSSISTDTSSSLSPPAVVRTTKQCSEERDSFRWSRREMSKEIRSQRNSGVLGRTRRKDTITNDVRGPTMTTTITAGETPRVGRSPRAYAPPPPIPPHPQHQQEFREYQAVNQNHPHCPDSSHAVSFPCSSPFYTCSPLLTGNETISKDVPPPPSGQWECFGGEWEGEATNPLPPPPANHRELTLPQLRSIIDRVYLSKDAYDQRCTARGLALETMRGHLHTYLQQRYGLPRLVQRVRRAIEESIQRYASKDGAVAAFGKILSNDVDEGFRGIQEEVRRSIPELLRFYLGEFHEECTLKEIEELVQERKRASYLEEKEWSFIIDYLYSREDAAFVKERIEKELQTRRQSGMNERVLSPRAQQNSGGGGEEEREATTAAEEDVWKAGVDVNWVKNNKPPPCHTTTTGSLFRRYSYSDFLQLILSTQLEGRERFLAPYVKLFREYDRQRTGVISREDFCSILKEIFHGFPKNRKAQRVLGRLPTTCTNYTFSQTVRALLHEM